MAFRQECCSGRLVGFLWGVFTPVGSSFDRLSVMESPASPVRARRSNGSEPDSQTSNSITATSQTSQSTPSPMKTPHLPTKTKYFYHPPASRGTVILPQKHYDRVLKLLLHLDYATLDVAIESSERWIGDVAMCAGRGVGRKENGEEGDGWGIEIIGEKEVESRIVGGGKEGGANVLGVRRKRDGEGEVQKGEEGVQMLSAGLVRKKAKVN